MQVKVKLNWTMITMCFFSYRAIEIDDNYLSSLLEYRDKP